MIIDHVLYETWSRGMSRMLGILILSYKLKEVINVYVFTLFENFKDVVSEQPDVWLCFDLNQNVAF